MSTAPRFVFFTNRLDFNIVGEAYCNVESAAVLVQRVEGFNIGHVGFNRHCAVPAAICHHKNFPVRPDRITLQFDQPSRALYG